jgi:uncharacterized protein YbjT (DUF2867 family)
VLGDLADRGSLSAAVQGADRMFLLCGPDPDEVQLNRNAIDAARTGGVRLLVRSSILGSDTASAATFVRDHGACDSYLVDSGVPHVIIRPNLFQQNVPQNTIPTIGDNGVFYVNAGQARVSMVDTRAVAAVADTALTQAGHEGLVYDVTGPEALSYDDVADKVSTALGRPITYVDVPDDAVRQALLGFGLTRWAAAAIVDLYQDYRRSGTRGYAAQVNGTVERLTGHPARSLDQLLTEVRPAHGS